MTHPAKRALTMAGLLVCLAAGWAASAVAQEASVLERRIDAAADALKDETRLRHRPAAERTAIVRFVAGNLLFVVLHELGHGLINEMGLPVLGREEDAADAFATVTMLGMRNEFSARVLADAARGWFIHDRRDRAMSRPLAFYGAHGLSRQRAYQIVCHMVGSDPERFAALAQEAGMPPARRTSCKGDFSNADWSWNRVLAPHRRTTQPKTPFTVQYHSGGERHAVIERALKHIGLLERVAERASAGFVWRAPVAMVARSCGKPHAEWRIAARTLTLCYELAAEFVRLYESDGVLRRARRAERRPR